MALALGKYVVPHGLSVRSYNSLIFGKPADNATSNKRTRGDFMMIGSGLSAADMPGARGGGRTRASHAKRVGRGARGRGRGVVHRLHQEIDEDPEAPRPEELGREDEGIAEEPAHVDDRQSEISIGYVGSVVADNGSELIADSECEHVDQGDEHLHEEVFVGHVFEQALAATLDEDFCPPVHTGSLGTDDAADRPPLPPFAARPGDAFVYHDDMALADLGDLLFRRPGPPPAPPPPPFAPALLGRGAGVPRRHTVDKYPRLRCLPEHMVQLICFTVSDVSSTLCWPLASGTLCEPSVGFMEFDARLAAHWLQISYVHHRNDLLDCFGRGYLPPCCVILRQITWQPTIPAHGLKTACEAWVGDSRVVVWLWRQCICCLKRNIGCPGQMPNDIQGHMRLMSLLFAHGASYLYLKAICYSSCMADACCQVDKPSTSHKPSIWC